jgi:hypothetical protein
MVIMPVSEDTKDIENTKHTGYEIFSIGNLPHHRYLAMPS